MWWSLKTRPPAYASVPSWQLQVTWTCVHVTTFCSYLYTIYTSIRKGGGEEQLESTSDLSGGEMQAGYQGCHIIWWKGHSNSWLLLLSSRSLCLPRSSPTHHQTGHDEWCHMQHNIWHTIHIYAMLLSTPKHFLSGRARFTDCSISR